MKHHQTDNGGHYGVSLEASGLGVLVQIMEGGNEHGLPMYGHSQARELLTPDEAMHLADLLINAAQDKATRS
jgi:hypothetical protein